MIISTQVLKIFPSCIIFRVIIILIALHLHCLVKNQQFLYFLHYIKNSLLFNLLLSIIDFLHLILVTMLIIINFINTFEKIMVIQCEFSYRFFQIIFNQISFNLKANLLFGNLYFKISLLRSQLLEFQARIWVDAIYSLRYLIQLFLGFSLQILKYYCYHYIIFNGFYIIKICYLFGHVLLFLFCLASFIFFHVQIN